MLTDSRRFIANYGTKAAFQYLYTGLASEKSAVSIAPVFMTLKLRVVQLGTRIRSRKVKSFAGKRSTADEYKCWLFGNAFVPTR